MDQRSENTEILRQKPAYRPLQRSLWVGLLLGFTLVMLGWILIPMTNPISILGACLVLGIYGLLNAWVLPRLNAKVLRGAVTFGLLAGLIFVAEILLEYALLPQDNTKWGLIEFGIVFFLYFLAGLWTSYRTQRLASGTLAAVSSAMLSALIWLIAILSVFYLFRGTPQQAQVFVAEGNYADFANSGMADFNAFIFEDFLGAGFFHLLLGPILASLLGTIGGLIGKGGLKARAILTKS